MNRKRALLSCLFVFFCLSHLPAWVVPYSNLLRDKLRYAGTEIRYDISNSIAYGEMAVFAYPAYGVTNNGMEAYFFIFLPPDAAVYKLESFIGGQWLDSRLIGRETAHTTYQIHVEREKRRLRPRDPAVMEYIGSDVYRLKLFPVDLTNDISTKIRWVQPVRHSSLKLIDPQNVRRHFAQIENSYHITVFQSGEKVFEQKYDKTTRSLPAEIKLKPDTNSQNQQLYTDMIKGNKEIADLRKNYKRDKKISWDSFSARLTNRLFVNETLSLIALEPDMEIINPTKESKYPIIITSGLGKNMLHEDGFGGFNAVILSPTEVEELFSPTNIQKRNLQKAERIKNILLFYQGMETRDIRIIARYLIEAQFIERPYSPKNINLWSLRELANITSIWREFKYIPRDNEVYAILKRRGYLKAYYLHEIVEFSHRFNLSRYGVSPYELFEYYY